jgi:hypothetical protein
MKVMINNKTVSVNPSKAVGKGGEADVFDIGNSRVLKLFKTPDHPDLNGIPLEQKAAKARLQEHQSKLPSFPNNLPSNIITPENLAYDNKGKKIVGYSMPMIDNASVLYSFSQRKFRQSISNNDIIKIFANLLSSVSSLHSKGVVIGDFNDLNVLIKGFNPYIIDTDSFQFGNFMTRTFTQDFTDPLNANPNGNSIELYTPYTPMSDWYSFATLLFQSLLFIKPYGGAYKPKDKSKRVTHPKRPLERITVFNDDVKYPVKQALHYSHLSPEILDYFYKIFHDDLREPFNQSLLDNISWKECGKCGLEYATNACPSCEGISYGLVVETTIIKGNLKVTNTFNTSGFIVYSKVENGELKYIYYENGSYFRENKEKITTGDFDNQIRFRINGKKTLLAKKGTLVVIKNSSVIDKLQVGGYGKLPVFDSNSKKKFWVSGKNLYKDGALGPEIVGQILNGQTIFWVGEKLGFGFYRAGNMNVGFVFDTSLHAISDSIDFPVIPGQLVDATTYISDKFIWFFASFITNGQKTNRCIVYDKNGNLIASKEDISGDGSWLSSIRGKTVFSNFLLSATDDGIIQLKVENSQIVIKNSYPDTSSYVESGSNIAITNDGVYVIDNKEITLLRLN